MTDTEAILKKEFELLKAELAEAYTASGMAVTGNWAEQIEVQASPLSASLKAPGYILGRKPGAPPPSQAIEKWLRDKGIASRIEKEMSISSLAYLIARKIGRMGWQPKEKDITERVITPERIQRIIDKAGKVFLTDFIINIANLLKEPA